MVSNRSEGFYLFSFLVLSLFLFPLSSFSQFAAHQISISEYANEPAIAIDPTNSNNVAVASNANFFYSSKDGGLSWKEEIISGTYGMRGDPSLTFDKAGRLYFAHLPARINGIRLARIVTQYMDENSNWSMQRSFGYQAGLFNDKPWITSNPRASDGKDLLVLTWTQGITNDPDFESFDSSDGSSVIFAKSENGDSWTEPVTISDRAIGAEFSDKLFEGSMAAIGPNGQIYVCWSSSDSGIWVDRSIDGGENFEADRKIGDMFEGLGTSLGSLKCALLPSITCDISALKSRGNVYLVWAGFREGNNDLSVFLSVSKDDGVTWSTPRNILPSSERRHQFFPSITVDQSTGRVYILYYDLQKVDGACDVYVARSADEGDSFTYTKVNAQTFDAIGYIGDYTQIVANNGIVMPVWSQTINAPRMYSGIFTTRIKDAVNFVEEAGLPAEEIIMVAVRDRNTIDAHYSLLQPSMVSFEVFDALGRKVMETQPEYMSTGTHIARLVLAEASRSHQALFVVLTAAPTGRGAVHRLSGKAIF